MKDGSIRESERLSKAVGKGAFLSITQRSSILANQSSLFSPSNPNHLGNRGVTYDLRTGVQSDASTLFTLRMSHSAS